ncbi:hypothetical protein CVT25_000774 [Psilocybe cyanescens]|uniref:Uncharacterized protein n=1 Tax=Psilocybe cyanescens TaxID=93625 RepID=A0A409XAP6_PSICY|nr:hypothetical protein CVT25_000774 [Psilocybe cyanescens]
MNDDNTPFIAGALALEFLFCSSGNYPTPPTRYTLVGANLIEFNFSVKEDRALFSPQKYRKIGTRES